MKEETISYINRKHIDLLNKLYYSVLSSIKVMILNKKIIKENGYELFEDAWKELNNDFNNIVSNLIDSPYILMPFSIEEAKPEYPVQLLYSKNDKDIFKSLIISFMEIHDLRILIYKDGLFVKDKFPLNMNGNEFKINCTYLLKGKLLNIDLIQFIVSRFSYRTLQL